MNTTVRDTYLEVVVGDIAKLNVDAVVNAAHSELWMSSGVAGAIKNGGGDGIEREAVAQGPIEVGDAIATTAGGLTARWVIHAAVTGPGRHVDANLIAQATTRALQVADRLGVHTLAMPRSEPARAASTSTPAPPSWWGGRTSISARPAAVASSGCFSAPTMMLPGRPSRTHSRDRRAFSS